MIFGIIWAEKNNSTVEKMKGQERRKEICFADGTKEEQHSNNKVLRENGMS